MVWTYNFGLFVAISLAVLGAASAETASKDPIICGGLRTIRSSPTSQAGYIVSPNSPNQYPAEPMQCTFKFLPNPDEQVQLTFIYFMLRESLHVQAITNCVGSDSLKIFIGPGNETANLFEQQVGEYCSGISPETVMAVGRPLTVVFTVRTTDNPHVALTARFKAHYTFTTDYGIMPHALPNHTAGVGCHFIFDGRSSPEQGDFHSPNFGGLYPYGTNCMYTFQAYGNQTIRLSFARFDVEGQGDCRRSEDDVVYIKEGTLPGSSFNTSAEDDPVKRDLNTTLYCGLKHPKVPAYLSAGARLDVVNVIFKSGQNGAGHGFHGMYSFEGYPGQRIPMNRSSGFSQQSSIAATLFGIMVFLFGV